MTAGKAELDRPVRQLLEYTKGILELRRLIPQKPGERFNIFSILNVEADEVNTHCRLLYEFLSPDGSHGMGDVFLRAFCDIVLQKPCPEHVSVSREQVFSDGRIDLLIEGNGVCYPIEVKIYAEDQRLQLSRYARFAARARESQVYYLTLDGRGPSEESTGGMTIPNLTCLSFSGEIRAWLVKCGELAWQVPAVAWALRQYIALTDRLTDRGREDEYMKLIQKSIGLSQESFESAMAVSAALEAVKAEKMREVFRKLETHVSKRLKPVWSTYEEDAAVYYSSSRKKVWPGIIYPIPHRDCGGLQLAVNIEAGWYLYYGLIFYRGDCERVPQEAGHLVNAFPNKAWKEFISSFKPQDDWWLWSEDLPRQGPFLNFKECSEGYPALYDPDRFQEIMSQLCTELDRGLDVLLKTGLWEDA